MFLIAHVDLSLSEKCSGDIGFTRMGQAENVMLLTTGWRAESVDECLFFVYRKYSVVILKGSCSC